VQLGQNAELAEVVVDGEGFTLYRFDDDDADPSRSNCSGSCAEKWPPVLVVDRITFRNLDPEQLGAVPRADGTLQVTVGGWPAYRFGKDEVPGQTAGQGVDGKWSVLGPDGRRAGAGSRSGSS
jgi:predicted lipoprotein with Yx(FWY)xxD motif